MILYFVFRYQTEGSRGAIKDRSGSGFPTVRLDGYNLPAKVCILSLNFHFVTTNGKVQGLHLFSKLILNH